MEVPQEPPRARVCSGSFILKWWFVLFWKHKYEYFCIPLQNLSGAANKDPLPCKMDVLKYKELGIGCLDSEFKLIIFMKMVSLKDKFWGEILSKQSFKQSCCLSSCFKYCSFGDHCCASFRGIRLPGAVLLTPSGLSTAGVSL